MSFKEMRKTNIFFDFKILQNNYNGRGKNS